MLVSVGAGFGIASGQAHVAQSGAIVAAASNECALVKRLALSSSHSPSHEIEILVVGQGAMSSNENQYRGGCHCGAVRFEFVMPSVRQLMRCNCSMCWRTDYLHLIVPHNQFRLLDGESSMREYRFNTGAARHLFCQRCGIKSFYQPRSHPQAWSINGRCVDDIIFDDFELVEFDGQNWSTAYQRLQKQ